MVKKFSIELPMPKIIGSSIPGRRFGLTELGKTFLEGYNYFSDAMDR